MTSSNFDVELLRAAVGKIAPLIIKNTVNICRPPGFNANELADRSGEGRILQGGMCLKRGLRNIRASLNC